jgi:hypothetical protein
MSAKIDVTDFPDRLDTSKNRSFGGIGAGERLIAVMRWWNGSEVCRIAAVAAF